MNKIPLPLLAGLFLLPGLNAATVSWSAVTATTSGGAGEVLNAGLFNTADTFVSAYNLGGTATVFDGITFATANTVASGSMTLGDVVISGASGTFDGFHANGQFLSEFGVYGNNGVTGTVAYTGLTVGNSYRVQALVFDGRGDAGIPGRIVKFDGISQGPYATGVLNNTWGTGMLVTGTFTADAATQNFTVESFLPDATTSRGLQLNALSLYNTTAIPEPSTYGLMAAGALGAVALVRRRRRA